MRKISIEVPEDILRATKIPLKEAPERLKKELAVRLYEQGILTFGKARQLAGITKWEFHRLLGSMGIPRQYDLDDFQTDLDTLQKLS